MQHWSHWANETKVTIGFIDKYNISNSFFVVGYLFKMHFLKAERNN